MKEFQFNQKLRFEQISTSFTNTNSRSSRSPAGREQIIHQHAPLADSYRINVHLHFRFAILKRILCGLRSVGKLAALSDWHKTDTELVGHRRSKNKSARIDRDNFVNLSPAAALQKKVNRRTKQDRIV